MRTTLDIDDDVLQTVRMFAEREGETAGQVLSDLARRGINAPRPEFKPAKVLNGFELLPADGRVVTPDLVHHLLSQTEDG